MAEVAVEKPAAEVHKATTIAKPVIGNINKT